MGIYLFSRMLPYPVVALSGFGPGLTINREETISVSSTFTVLCKNSRVCSDPLFILEHAQRLRSGSSERALLPSTICPIAHNGFTRFRTSMPPHYLKRQDTVAESDFNYCLALCTYYMCFGINWVAIY